MGLLGANVDRPTRGFHYQVPQKDSHYKIYFCCEWNSDNAPTSFNGTPAYSGTLTVDPATGAVLRVTLEIEFDEFDPPPQYSVAVQYGPVDIAGRTAVLPLHSITIGEGKTLAHHGYRTNFYLDDIRFTDYRRFGSTARIVTNAQSQ